jgi:hypothetical protein
MSTGQEKVLQIGNVHRLAGNKEWEGNKCRRGNVCVGQITSAGHGKIPPTH